jgi:hypothetical protein
MRIAWFSPLYTDGPGTGPNAHSISAYTTELLLPQLIDEFAIELFHAGPGGRYVMTNGKSLPLHNYLNAALLAEEKPFDVFFYQVEDSPCSGFIRHHLGLKPGIVWFHTILFRHRAPDPLSHSPWQQIIEYAADASKELPSEHVWPETNNPYPYREAALAIGALFSAPWAHGEFLRRRENSTHLIQAFGKRSQKETVAPSAFLSLPISAPVSSTDCYAENKSGFVVGFLGGAGSESRFSKVATALEPGASLTWFVFAGEVQEVTLLARLYPHVNVTIITLTSPFIFAEQIIKVDCLFMLHFSLYGNYSPWLDIALNAGIVSAVSDFGHSLYLSASEVIKVPLGSSEVEHIKCLIALLQEKKFQSYESNSSVSFDRKPNNPKHVANELATFFLYHSKTWKNFLADWDKIETMAQEWVTKEATPDTKNNRILNNLEAL